MKESIEKGIGFGLTSGIITTLGLMVGLNSGTHSAKVVISGILVIAIADALSDALGMHISEETNYNRSTREVWEATIFTFLAKFIFASIFIIPVLFFSLKIAIIISIIFGLILISLFSSYIAWRQNESYAKIISEHLVIALLVIIITQFIGDFIYELL